MCHVPRRKIRVPDPRGSLMPLRLQLSPHRQYRALAQFWCVAFVITGLEFAFVPGWLAGLMTELGQRVGLRGTVDLTPWTPWHVIALSLMIAVTVLAWQSAQRPEAPGPYVALQAAKVASTLLFLWLAVTDASIWLVSAATDGGIALSLWLVRRKFPRAAVMPGFARALMPSPGYEVWYGKVDLGPACALWFRYTFHDGDTAECATWALLFAGEQVYAGKRVWPLAAARAHGVGLLPASADSARFAKQHTVFQVADAHLDDANAIGSAGEVSWDLSWADRGARFEHTPWLLRQLGLVGTTFRSPLADLRVSGTVRFGSEVIAVREATGALGHLHGRRHAESWAWAHCNHFDGGIEATFEAISARVRVAGWVTPPLTSIRLRLDGATLVFSTLRNLARTKTAWGKGVWKFSSENREMRLEGEATAPEDSRVAVVAYRDPDGSPVWCTNSKLACLTLTLVHKRSGRRQILTSGNAAAFEEGDRHPPQRAIAL